MSNASALGRAVHSAAMTLVTDVLNVSRDETVLISTDPGGDAELPRLIADAVTALRATPIQVVFPPSPHPGSAVHPGLRQLSAGSDVWIELNKHYIEGTHAHIDAEAAGLRRFYSLTGMDAADFVSFVGEVDSETVTAFGERLAELSNGRHELRVSCPNGSDFRASIEGRVAEVDTTLMPLGQTHVFPDEDTMRGTLVFDGSAFPPDALGVLRGTITLEFDGGRARVAAGGRESEVFAAWAADLHDPEIYRMCHLSYGYHPSALFPSGSLVNDERVFGCLCIGFGPPMPYDCHTDLTILEPTVGIDGNVVQRDGKYLDPVLVELAKNLGVPGYAEGQAAERAAAKADLDT